MSFVNSITFVCAIADMIVTIIRLGCCSKMAFRLKTHVGAVYAILDSCSSMEDGEVKMVDFHDALVVISVSLHSHDHRLHLHHHLIYYSIGIMIRYVSNTFSLFGPRSLIEVLLSKVCNPRP